MDPPRLVINSSTKSSITVEWNALGSGKPIGGSVIDSYKLNWDAGTNGASY